VGVWVDAGGNVGIGVGTKVTMGIGVKVGVIRWASEVSEGIATAEVGILVL
jgi:hypothetical protein